MKFQQLIFSALILLISSATANSQTSRESNVDLAKSFFEIVLSDDSLKAKDMLDDGFKFYYMGNIPLESMGDLALAGTYNKETYFDDFLQKEAVLIPDGVVLTPTDVIADAKGVALVMEGSGQGVNGEYNNKYVFIFKMNNGKILSLTEYGSDLLVATRLYRNKIAPMD